MSLLYTDGFGGATVGSGLGDNYLAAQGYNGSGAGDAVTGYGGAGVAIYNLQGVYSRTVTSIASGTGIVVGMRVKVDSGTGSQLGFQLENGSGVQLTLYIDRTNRRVLVYRGTSGGTLLVTGNSAAFEFGEWFYLELKVKVHDTTGYVECRIGEALCAAVLTEGDTQNQAAGTVTLVGFQFPNCYVDDFYALDDQGSAPTNDFLGDTGFEAGEDGADLEFEEKCGVRERFALRPSGRTDIIAAGWPRR